MEFTVQERQLPKLAGFALRVDSSLGAGLALPEQAAADACAGAMAAAADGVPTAAVCARMLPELEALAAAHSEGRVCANLRVHFRPAALFCDHPVCVATLQAETQRRLLPSAPSLWRGLLHKRPSF